LIVTVVDTFPVCIVAKVTASLRQVRQLVAQLSALVCAPCLLIAGQLPGGLLLLAPRIEKASGSLFSLAGSLVALDDLWPNLNLLSASSRARAEMHVPLSIDPAIYFGRCRQRGEDK